MTTKTSYEPGSICWVDLMTSSAEKARDFYKALFNWTFAIGGPESGYYSMAKLGEDSVGGLGEIQPGMNMPPAWSVYFASDNIDATAERVKANGGNVVVAPMDVMEEGRMGVFVDPTGAVFGVWQPKRHTGAQRAEEPGSMAWHECVTGDPKKACDFYSKVFGLEAKHLGGEMEYFTLHKGSKTVAGINPSQKHPHWSTYFAVGDCDASAKRVTELGGKVFQPPFDTPYGRLAFVADPQGAAFAIVQAPKK